MPAKPQDDVIIDVTALEQIAESLANSADAIEKQTGVLRETTGQLHSARNELVHDATSALNEGSGRIREARDELGATIRHFRLAREELVHDIARAVVAEVKSELGENPNMPRRRKRGRPLSAPELTPQVAAYLRFVEGLSIPEIARRLSAEPFNMRTNTGKPLGNSHVQELLRRAAAWREGVKEDAQDAQQQAAVAQV